MLAKSLMHRADIRCAFSPVIDGVTLKDAPVKLAQKSNKPLLIGSVKEESNYHIRIAPTWLLPIFGKILGMKPIKGNAPYRERFARGLDIHIYRGPIKEIADNYTGNVWVYEYHYMTEDIKNQGYGCYHVCDLSVLFGQDSFITRVHDPETDRVGKQMRELWGNFARSGECEWERSFANPHIIK